MKIKITEKIEQEVIGDILTESFSPYTEKVLIVKDYLDKNFTQGNIDDIDENGYPVKIGVVNMINNNQVVKTLQGDEILLLLNDKFNKIIKNNEDRNKFLKQVLTDWFDGKISKNGLLSVNTI